MRTRIKICGITHPEDARLAADLGADALGLVFYSKSTRAVSLEQALLISSIVPPFVSTVALVVNAEESLLHTLCTSLYPAYLQFHGDESANDCVKWKYPYIKAVRMKQGTDIVQIMKEHINPWCRGILLDAYHPALPGGTGETFDWSVIPKPEQRVHPLILAGGLKPDNIEKAIQEVQPWAVDVSSGVEYAPGRKCPTSLRAFIQGALHAVVPFPR